jgi:GTPase SAR1 family protein
VAEWVQSVIDNTDKAIKMVLVGNKIDLTREVTTEEGKKLADYYKIPFFETSAKENVGISDCIRTLLQGVLDNFKQDESGFKLENNSNTQEKKKGCCK